MIRYRIEVKSEEFQNRLDKLTKEASLETVWVIRHMLMKKDVPFMGYVKEEEFHISRLNDIWAYPVFIQGLINTKKNELTIIIKPLKTAYIYFGLYITLCLCVSSSFIFTHGFFNPLPMLFGLFPFFVVPFTKKHLLRLFEHTFRNHITKISEQVRDDA